MYPTGPRKLDIRLLGSAGAAVACPVDTTEDILATIAIPAELMGLNGILAIESFWTATNNANVKTVRMRLGGIAGTQFMTIAMTSQANLRDRRMILNRASQAVQIGFDAASNLFGLGAGAAVVGAINTAVDQTLVLTGQKATAGDTLQLEYFTCELWRPDTLTSLYS
jgi:predicted amino acid dehydrogenase